MKKKLMTILTDVCGACGCSGFLLWMFLDWLGAPVLAARVLLQAMLCLAAAISLEAQQQDSGRKRDYELTRRDKKRYLSRGRGKKH